MKIALDFANMSVERTKKWIQENNPSFSHLEADLEWVRLMYFETGKISVEHWTFFEKTQKERIKRDWAKRFRKMMRENNWNYEEVAKMGDFRNGKVIEATISRGLPSFAKLCVMIHERQDRKVVF